MGMQINTNLAALNAHRNLSNTQNDLSKSLEKLSSGLRINRAADDAAGLAISEGLRSQVNGMNVAARNAQDGISVIQTAEGALTETHSILQRMRDLAVQAGNDSNNTESRKAITTEANQLADELARISQTTNFNGIKLLDGKVNAAGDGILKFQIGADGNANGQIDVNLKSADVSALAAGLKSGYSGTSFVIADAALAGGAMEFTVNEGGSESVITTTLGAAGAYASVDEVVSALNADSGFSSQLRAIKNSNGELEVTSKSGGAVTAAAAGAGVLAGTAGVQGDLDFMTAAGAQAAIGSIDGQIKVVSEARSELGAVQNRFESAINSLNVSRENLQAAESRIRDVDMAAEMVNFTRSNILSQAGTAMLAQANQSNQGVLQLLG